MSEKAKFEKRIIVSYARAMFQLSEKMNLLKKINEEFFLILNLLSLNPKIKKIITIPILKISNKNALIDIIVSDYKLSHVMKNFLLLLVANNRFAMIIEIANYFNLLLLNKNGEKNIEITSSSGLDIKEKSSVERALEGVYGCKIHIVEKISPEIIGGLIMKDGTKMYDSTILNKIKRLELLSKQEIYTSKVE
jgi:F-type H+-transporting ATPase subunit delta